MKTVIAFMFLAPVLFAQDAFDTMVSSANMLADSMIKASGGDNWPRVKSIDFTFNVEQSGKKGMAVKHHWDLVANTDTVERDGKTTTIDLGTQNNEGDAKDAYRRWVNDSYWLLAPLKLRDHGTHLSDKGEQQIDGKTLRVLEIRFDQVGLTPHDKYNFYIDPANHLVVRWDYMPSPQKTLSGTWEKYQDFGGLKLAMEHQFNGRRIYFTDVKVETTK